MDNFKIHKKVIDGFDEYGTWCLVQAAWDAQQAAIDSGELPWDHPDPDPSVVGPNAQPAPARSAGQVITIGSRPAAQPAPAKPQAKAKPSATPKAQKPTDAKPAEQLAIPQVHLPDVSLASEGRFSQRLKRVQKLSKNPSPAEIVELTVYLAGLESGLRWLASATLSKIGGPRVEASVTALLTKDISDDAREKASKVLGQIPEN